MKNIKIPPGRVKQYYQSLPKTLDPEIRLALIYSYAKCLELELLSLNEGYDVLINLLDPLLTLPESHNKHK